MAGCSYTGSSRGAILMEMLICANPSADMASSSNANDIKRRERRIQMVGIRIVFPLALSFPGLPAEALLLRVAWIERRDLRAKHTCRIRFARKMVLTETL